MVQPNNPRPNGTPLAVPTQTQARHPATTCGQLARGRYVGP